MLDVVHYLFESDSLAEKEMQDAKTRMRRSIYGNLYDRSYTWGEDTYDDYGGQEASGGARAYQGNDAAGPPRMTHKPYTPPTPVNAASPKPFGNVLDAPIG
jgi:hypothetical protein